MTFNEANGLPPGVLGEAEGQDVQGEETRGSSSGDARHSATGGRESAGDLWLRYASDHGWADASATRREGRRPGVWPHLEGDVRDVDGNMIVALVLWFIGLLLVAFGILMTWLGDGVGEMTNFIIAGVALRWFAHDLAE